MVTISDESRIMMIDGHALVHRAFHALPDTLSTSSGELTNAVLGFTNIVLKEIGELRPRYVVMAMDRPGPTFRHTAYAEYKATRPPTPRPLVSQFKRVREVAEALNIAIYEVDGYEADDVLGTLSREAEERGLESVIVTGDLDAVQLVSDHIRVLMPGRGVSETTEYDVEAVNRRYGLDPAQIPDWKALVGDSSDNIPGVRGIGAKGASKLLAEYGNLEGIYGHLDELPGKLRDLLQPAHDQALASRELARIVRNAPVALNLEAAAFDDVDRARLVSLFRELEFYSLIDRIGTLVPRSPAPSTPANNSVHQLTMFEQEPGSAVRSSPDGAALGPSSGVQMASPVYELGSHVQTRVVTNEAELQALVQELQATECFAFDTETTSTDPTRAKLVGLSFATRPGRGWYVPVGHVEGEQLELDVVLRSLRRLLVENAPGKVGHNLKYDYAVMAGYGVELGGLEFDTMIAAYLCNPTGRNLSLGALALAKLGVEMIPIDSLIGKGRNQITMDLLGIESAGPYAGEDAAISLELKPILESELSSRELISLFRDIEMPLVRVLADMEMVGVKLDTPVLSVMSQEMSEVIARLEGEVFATAGRPFNINSTQQLGQVLFGQLGLPSGRRTKTGHSTDNEVLESLRGRHEIVDQILEYRQLIKLRSTYVDALPSLINPKTGRVHTDFNQCVAATGRLSSSNPNLQNIPVRGELGRKIRRAFVPLEPDHVLLAADYSQIELRILASMSEDPRLVQAFLSGEDIHRATASAVFGVPLDAVTSDERRIAKVVNFGIIYGIGENRLAHETGISRAEAAEFIANYNRTYAGVKAFMEAMRRRAAAYGYVSTLMNRRRYIPEIHSPHPGIRTAAERAAINMPIQGTAADIIKIAMIRLQAELARDFPEAHMVLQVHDELVFDVPSGEVMDLARVVQDVMEHAVSLNVPIEIEMKVGDDWYDMAPLERAA